MERAVFLCCDPANIRNSYPPSVLARLSAHCTLEPTVYSREDVLAHPADFSDCRLIFSTWGMPCLTEEELARAFPALRALFYAAGSVQPFARPLFRRGVRVFAAHRANAIPVAEFTFAQIILALKGVHRSALLTKTDRTAAYQTVLAHPGAYRAKVGLVGMGTIGRLVAERLKSTDADILCFDKFLSDREASALGVKKTDLATLFSECDVISNHLANKPELVGLFDFSLFSRMHPYATFLNTGRGAQVNNADLARALRADPTLTALLDVTEPEVLPPDSPLLQCENAILTPHIAGSLSGEVARMGAYMADALEQYLDGKPSAQEVFADDLITMA